MPTETAPVIETPTETFSSFAGRKPGGAEPRVQRDAPVEVEDKTDPASQTAGTETQPQDPPASEAATEQSKVEKRKQQIQREIDDLVRKREELKREVSVKPTEVVSRETPPVQGVDPKDPEPKRPDSNDPKYKYWGEYAQDEEKYRDERAAWVARNEHRRLELERDQKSKAEEAQREHAAAQKRFTDRESEFAAEHSDYRELTEQFKEKPMSDWFAAALLEVDDGPAVLHHLMTNPEEYDRIGAIKAPAKVFAEIYKLRYETLAKKESLPAPEPKKSAAPPVGTRLNGSGGSSSREAKSFQDFRKQRSA